MHLYFEKQKQQINFQYFTLTNCSIRSVNEIWVRAVVYGCMTGQQAWNSQASCQRSTPTYFRLQCCLSLLEYLSSPDLPLLYPLSLPPPPHPPPPLASPPIPPSISSVEMSSAIARMSAPSFSFSFQLVTPGRTIFSSRSLSSCRRRSWKETNRCDWVDL